MVDVDSALASVQERDNWRRRMEVLERTLAEVREQRKKLEVRLRRVRKELARVRLATEAALEISRSLARPEVMRVSTPAGALNR
jgi:septal ring factor EnvC (AmiA/AmiB activator)